MTTEDILGTATRISVNYERLPESVAQGSIFMIKLVVVRHGESIWRRSYDVLPPSLTITDDRYPGNEKKYQMI